MEDVALRPSHGRLRILTALAALIGLASGGAAWALLKLIALVTNLALLHRYSWEATELEDFHPGAWLIPVAIGGAFVVSLLARWAPGIKGHGIPEAIDAVLTRQSRVSPRTAAAKPASIVISLGTGAPFGAEGPIIMTGGAIGSIIGQVLPVTPSERKILMGCGAAAGTAAIFGTPVAAVVLAVELLLFEFSTRSLVPLIVASSVAGSVHLALLGSRPLFDVENHEFSGLNELWLYALLGVACGLLAVLVCRGLFVMEAIYRKIPAHNWHPLIGAFGFAVIGLAVPRILGTGYFTIQETLWARLSIGTLAVVLIAKLLAWWVALASETSGSILAPMLFVGGTFGALIGNLVDEAAPSLEVSIGAIAFVAMAATFGASIGASFTAIVFAFELTRDYSAILPLMLATVIAELVAMALLDQNLLTEKLSRKGVRVPKSYEPDLLGHTYVRQAMTAPVDTLDETTTIAKARRAVGSGLHRSYPMVDERGACIGIVTRSDLLQEGVPDDEPVAKVASRDVVTVTPETSMLDALSRLVDEGVNQLPVVDDGRLVGICTRTDILKVRSRRLNQDKKVGAGLPWRQPWRMMTRGRFNHGSSGADLVQDPGPGTPLD